MPVITRLMTAHGSNSGSLVLSSSDRSTCITEQSMPSDNNVSDTQDSVIHLLELVDQSGSSSASFDHDDSSSSSTSSSDDDFEISNFQNCNCEFPSTVQFFSYSHNFELETSIKMESDCQDEKCTATASENVSSNDSIMQMLTMISGQMMTNYQELQDRLLQTELKFSQDLQRIQTENATLKQDLQAVLQQNSLSQATPLVSVPSPSSQGSVVLIASTPSSSTNSNIASSTVTAVSPGSSPDFQIQMLSLLQDTFSKLTTVIADSKTPETKSEWPKFSGDTKKFRSWYLAIMA